MLSKELKLHFFVEFELLEHFRVEAHVRSQLGHHHCRLLRSKGLSLLVPSPLVDLGFAESGLLGHVEEGLFGPVRVSLELTHQDLELVA